MVGEEEFEIPGKDPFYFFDRRDMADIGVTSSFINGRKRFERESFGLVFASAMLLSQNGRILWDRMRRLIKRWLPPVRIFHDYPLRRMGVVT